MLDVSIPREDEAKLNSLQADLSIFGVKVEKDSPIIVPWFPKNLRDLDLVGVKPFDVQEDYNKDHLQFSDPQYRERRNFISDVSKEYKMGSPIPEIPYSQSEVQLWQAIFRKLRALHHDSMSSRYQAHMRRIEKEFSLSQRIPQLEQISNYLKAETGFTLKPINGILSEREALNAFAFKVFCCTQYIRHHKTPDYIPEPDIVHEVVGHAPMLADPDVAVIVRLRRNSRTGLDCYPSEPPTSRFRSWAPCIGIRWSSESVRKPTGSWAMELA